ATVLFLIWGGYQGLLLVAHRQLEQLERRLDWHRSRSWTPISWFATAALISLGWIFFRANSLSQAREMLVALVSPQSYGSPLLSWSLYVLIGVLAAGYGLVLLIGRVLDRDLPETIGQDGGILPLLLRSRWFWLPAVYALALLVVLMITLTQQGGVGQMMYRSF